MTQPLVTVITPSYNQGRFIKETIESVLTQSYSNIEYIVVDGGSTDETLSILESYKDRLVYISEKDKGQSDAINKGFRMAHGEIVAWLNSDDVYEPGCVQKAVDEFKKNRDLGLVYGDGYIISEDSTKIRVFEYTQEFDFWKLVNLWDYVMQPAAFFRLDKLKEVGYLDIDLKYCMDWDLWIKLASVSEVKYIPSLLACSREYELTKTSTGGNERLDEISALLRKYSKKSDPVGIKSYRASTLYVSNKDSVFRFFWVWNIFRVHRQILSSLPVLYQDGWMGKEYAFIIPGYINKCCLHVSTIRAIGKQQLLYIYEDGELSQSIHLQMDIGKDIIIPNETKRNKEVRLVCRVVKRIRGEQRYLGARVAVNFHDN